MAIIIADGTKIPGSITTDARTGRQRVRVTVDGERVTLPGSFEHESDAIGAAVHFWRGHLAQKPKTLGLKTVNEWGLEHLDERETDGVHRAVDRDRSRWNARIGGTKLGELYIDTITPDDVRDWLSAQIKTPSARTKRRPKKQTIANALNLLRVVMEAAVTARHIAENPVRNVRLPKFATDQIGWDWLRAHEINAIAIHPGLTLEDRILFVFAVCTGLRKGELWGLQWSDIDFDRAEVVVARSYDGPTKGGVVRRVPLLAPALEAIRFWFEHTPRLCSLVFPTPDERMRARRHNSSCSHNAKRDLVAVMREVTGRQIRFHDLRHTCASHLIQGTWAPKWADRALRLEEVKEWLGHTKIATTERYAHLADEAIRGRVKRLGVKGKTDVPAVRGTPNLAIVRDGKAIVGHAGRSNASGRGVDAVDAGVLEPISEVLEISAESGGVGGTRTRVERFCKPAFLSLVSHTYEGPRPLSVRILALLQAAARKESLPGEQVIDALIDAAELALASERKAALRAQG